MKAQSSSNSSHPGNGQSSNSRSTSGGFNLRDSVTASSKPSLSLTSHTRTASQHVPQREKLLSILRDALLILEDDDEFESAGLSRSSCKQQGSSFFGALNGGALGQ